mmetsp:Transcript_3541/g.8092  ORF Transcript_3541/g.8092 Transcript_3541/m.8092 type:complete len:242 (-) Transcript_3541:175-900(-)
MVPISLATSQLAASPGAVSVAASIIVKTAASASPAFFLPAAVSALRGGGGKEAAAAAAAFDLTRARIRLEGLSAYGVTTGLLMNAAMRLYSSTPKKMKDLSEIDDDDGKDDGGGDAKRVARMENWVTVIFAALVTVTIMSGMYTTITFSLLALYSKTALGMGADAQYLQFLEMTEPIRRIGFDTYIVSLLCFKGAFVCSLFLTFKGRLRYWLSGVGTLGLAYSWYNIKTIMSFASTLLFGG